MNIFRIEPETAETAPGQDDINDDNYTTDEIWTTPVLDEEEDDENRQEIVIPLPVFGGAPLMDAVDADQLLTDTVNYDQEDFILHDDTELPN